MPNRITTQAKAVMVNDVIINPARYATQKVVSVIPGAVGTIQAPDTIWIKLDSGESFELADTELVIVDR